MDITAINQKKHTPKMAKQKKTLQKTYTAEGGCDSGVGMSVAEAEGMGVGSVYVTGAVTMANINQSGMYENEENSDESMENQNIKNENINTTITVIGDGNSRGGISNASYKLPPQPKIMDVTPGE